MRLKQLTTAIVVVLILGASVVISVNGMLNRGPSGNGGLYDLGATIVELDVSGVTATPQLIDTIEQMYVEVYGDYSKGDVTIDDARADSEFWDTYCDFSPMVERNRDGTYDVITSYDGWDSTVRITVPQIDRILSTSTIYMTDVYYLLCERYGVEPYSDAALDDTGLVSEFQEIIAGGTTLEYIESNTDLIDYFDPESYLSRVNSFSNYDREQIGEDVRQLSSDGSNVLFCASGSGMGVNTGVDGYTEVRKIVRTNGGVDAIFPKTTSIPQSFAGIQLIGYILGFEDEADALLERLQTELYRVYVSLQDRSDEEHKVYWETTAGKSISPRGMTRSLMDFFGWDTSLVTGTEIDTETLLRERPDVLIFYDDDSRDWDTKMRV